MRDCSEHLLRFGGHRAAAGCAILPERVEAFRAAFDTRAGSVLSDEQLVPEVKVDLEIPLAEADEELCRLLKHAAPFGMGNPTPVFLARGVHLAGAPKVVGGSHLKLALAASDRTLDAIGFGMADRLDEVGARGVSFDLAFKLEENEWKGSTRAQARIVDLRPSR
jgi:single-stranded-DNA-specific exonuclease